MADRDFQEWKHKKTYSLTANDVVEFFKLLLTKRDYTYYDLIQFLSRFKKQHEKLATQLFRSPNLINSIIDSIEKPYYATVLLYFIEFQVKEVEHGVCKLLKKDKTYELNKQYEDLRKYELKGQTNRQMEKDVSCRIWDLVYMVSERMKIDIDVNCKIRWLCMLRGRDTEEMSLINRLIINIQKEQRNIKMDKTLDLLKDRLCGANNIAILINRVGSKDSWVEALSLTIKRHEDPASLLNTLFYSCYPPETLAIVASAFKSIAKQNDILDNVVKDFVIPRLLPNLSCCSYVLVVIELIRNILGCGDKLNLSGQELKLLDKHSINEKQRAKHKDILERIRQKAQNRGSVESKGYNKGKDPDRQNQWNNDRYGSQINRNGNQTKADEYGKYRINDSQLEKDSPPRQCTITHKHSSAQYISYESNDYIGLPNQKNDCYINSFVISLYFIRQFKEFFLEQKVEDKALIHLQKIYKALDLKEPGDLPELLKEFKQQLPKQFSDNNQQHDAMSFGRIIFQKITTQPSISAFAKNLFELHYKELIVCPDSHESSRTQATETNIILPFEKQIKTREDTFSVMNMIEQYFKRVKIENNFKCQKCKRTFKYCIKQISNIDFPEILIVALNRSEFDKAKGQSRKILEKVQIKDNLYVGDIKSLSLSRVDYRLYGFINHLGDKMESGHYQAYARHPENRSNWIWIDDDQVKEIDCEKLQKLLNSFGYDDVLIVVSRRHQAYSFINDYPPDSDFLDKLYVDEQVDEGVLWMGIQANSNIIKLFLQNVPSFVQLQSIVLPLVDRPSSTNILVKISLGQAMPYSIVMAILPYHFTQPSKVLQQFFNVNSQSAKDSCSASFCAALLRPSDHLSGCIGFKLVSS